MTMSKKTNQMMKQIAKTAKRAGCSTGLIGGINMLPDSAVKALGKVASDYGKAVLAEKHALAAQKAALKRIAQKLKTYVVHA
jgi:hypothetical protein